MTALGPAAFGALVWGVIGLVVAVFVYEVYAVAADLGWLPTRPQSRD